MTKLLSVSGYVRRSPSKPSIYIEKHEQLRREVEAFRFEAALNRMAEALEIECEQDARFMNKLGFA